MVIRVEIENLELKGKFFIVFKLSQEYFFRC